MASTAPAASSTSSNPPNPSVSNKSPVLLETKPGGEGINLSLHPLPILNVSEHFTRSRIQNPDEPPKQVYGALLGTQSSRDIEIQNTFEILIKKESALVASSATQPSEKGKEKIGDSQMEGTKGAQVDIDFLKSRLAQFKQVFPTFEFLGWYSVGTVPTPADLEVHKQLLDFNEAPLFLQLTPTISSFQSAQSSGELPISLYESVVELTPASNTTNSAIGTSDSTNKAENSEGMEATMFFVQAPYHIETGEAERIAVDHTSKPPEDGDGESSAILANLQTQLSSISMLSDRINLVLTYMQSVQSGALAKDHESLRQIKSLLSNLPAGEGEDWKNEYLTEYNDVMMTSYLTSLTKSLNTMNELVDKHDLLTAEEERGQRSGGPSRRHKEKMYGSKGFF